jgi:hypothetical protein
MKTWGFARDVTRRARRGPWRARSSPKGPHASASVSELNQKAWGDGFPPLGIPFLVGAARKGGSKGGNQAGGGAARPLPHTLTLGRQMRACLTRVNPTCRPQVLSCPQSGRGAEGRVSRLYLAAPFNP